MTPVADVYCLMCGALPGKPCLTNRGDVSRVPHVVRAYSAERLTWPDRNLKTHLATQENL